MVVPTTAVHGDHDPSGVGEVPVRVSNAMFVNVGRFTVGVSCCHVPPSPKCTRDVNVQGVAYGPMRIQSTDNALPPAVSSFAAGRIGAVMATSCVTTSAPSMKYFTFVEVHSIRYVCGAPR